MLACEQGWIRIVAALLLLQEKGRESTTKYPATACSAPLLQE